MLLDTRGRPLAVEVKPADVQDRVGGKTIVDATKHGHRQGSARPGTHRIWADAGLTQASWLIGLLLLCSQGTPKLEMDEKSVRESWLRRLSEM